MIDLTLFEAGWAALVAIGIHRLWLYEEIFSQPRNWARGFPQYWLRKMLTCEACFAFWAGVLALVLAAYRHSEAASVLWWALGLYPVVRGVMSFYSTPIGVGAKKVFDILKQSSSKSSTPTLVTEQQTPAPAAPCQTCGQKSGDLAVILTTFSDFSAAYSLVTCVLDQARALVRIGYQVQVWVNDGCNLQEYPRTMPDGVAVRAIMPLIPCKEDVVDEAGVTTAVRFFEPELSALQPKVVISHDLLFQTWFVTWAAAIHRIAGAYPTIKWFHQAHSAPSLPRSIPAGAYHRMTIPEGHRVLCVNYVDRIRFAEYYAIKPDRIVSVPNARDLRSWVRMGTAASQAVDKLKLDEADLVQVYGVSGTRMDAKGLMTIFDVFAALKAESELKVKLVIVNAHSNLGTDPEAVKVQHAIDGFTERAEKAGLVNNEDFYFTSRVFPEWSYGVPGDVMASLQQYGNLFVFPTIGEAGSLVLMEAALSGALLVLNQDVAALADVIPHDQALWYSFGNGQGAPRKAVPIDVANAIEAAYRTNKVLRSKRTVVQHQSLKAYADRLKIAIAQ